MEKFCQSCAMPLTADNCGTNADGSASTTYCQYCYQNGEFTQPNLTFVEMKQIGLKGIAADNSTNAFKKFLLKLSYGPLLKKMKRWQD